MQIESDWWRGHFTGLMTDLWRSILPPEQSAKDAAFLVAASGTLPPNARILDVPCGEGRVSLELSIAVWNGAIIAV